METTRFTLGKKNVIMIAIGFLVVVIGYLLMTGEPSGVKFNPEIFSFRRITFAPMVSFAGFLFIVFAILYQPNKKNK